MSWLQAVGWLFTGLALLGAAAHWTSIRSQVWIVIATGAHYLMALSLPALIVFAITVQPFGLAASGIAVLLGVTAHLTMFRAEPDDLDGPVLRVLTANLLLGRGDADAVLQTLREHAVDVLLVQELTPELLVNLRSAGIDDVLEHSFTYPQSRGAGTGIWSRYRLAEQLSHPGFDFEVLSARLLLDDESGPLIWSVHLEPPWPRPAAGWLADLPHLDQLLQAVPRAAGPAGAVVAGGDYNATFNHRQFRRLLTGGYRDAAVMSGSGPLLSWPSGQRAPSLLGLDHLLLRSAAVRWMRTIQIPHSDHRAVLAEIVLAGPDR